MIEWQPRSEHETLLALLLGVIGVIGIACAGLAVIG